MGYIYILSEDGTPLMPTLRKNHVQKLLKRGKARVVEYVPFVVQLKYSTPGITQPLYGETDPGRTNIGNAVIDSKKEKGIRSCNLSCTHPERQEGFLLL